MKKKLVTLVAMFAALSVAGVAVMPAATFADTSTTTTTASSSIQAELNLIASLTAQIQALQQQIVALQSQVASTTVSLVQSLSLGSQGDQVKVLQALLASDPGIYPQGLITGYFGQLTEDAVRRFQETNGISAIGIVGPLTRGKLNQLLHEHPLEFENESSTTNSAATGTSMNGENNDNGNGSDKGNQNGQGEGNAHDRLCAIVPPGHLIAPGWLRKNDNEQPIVPACQTLPPGIEDQLNATSTPNPTSTVTLSVSGVASSVATSTATVSWSTNLAATSQVFYGATNAYGSSTAEDATLVTSHSVMLSGLAPSTAYHFEAVSTNASGTATSSDMTFTTNALPDTTPPVISSITFSAASTTANIVWMTNEPATGNVYYGTTNPLDLTASSTANMGTSTLVTNHSFNLTGLTASTTYFYLVSSTDGSGNTATSTQQSFTTTN